MPRYSIDDGDEGTRMEMESLRHEAYEAAIDVLRAYKLQYKRPLHRWEWEVSPRCYEPPDLPFGRQDEDGEDVLEECIQIERLKYTAASDPFAISG